MRPRLHEVPVLISSLVSSSSPRSLQAHDVINLSPDDLATPPHIYNTSPLEPVPNDTNILSLKCIERVFSDPPICRNRLLGGSATSSCTRGRYQHLYNSLISTNYKGQHHSKPNRCQVVRPFTSPFLRSWVPRPFVHVATNSREIRFRTRVRRFIPFPKDLTTSGLGVQGPFS